MSSSIPQFSHTSVESIPGIVDLARSTFEAHATRSIQYRLVQLRKLYWGIKDHEQDLIEACRLDLGKPAFEVFISEVGWCLNDIVYTCKNLERWVRDEKAADIPLANAPVSPKIRKDPLGVVLVIGAFNFPVQLAFGPMVGAIAAGNTVVLKPSEICPNTAAVVQKIVADYLDPTAYTVVQGAVPETTALLDQKWDKIFYTGNSTIGTIIAKKAAETLTPVTLELGGQNPAIVTKHADPRLAARRLLWGKVLNAGQVCLSENYALVDREILAAFIEEFKVAAAEFFPKGAKLSPDFGRIVNSRHFHRIKAMLDNSNGKIVIGGTMDENEKFIEPTVVVVDSLHDALVKDEIFGPLLPILAFDNLDEAIKTANKIHSTPLAMYAFGSTTETDKILRETRSGGASINDTVEYLPCPQRYSTIIHGAMPTLEFGGVGSSGQGSYRGRASFDCFSHRRAVTKTPSWIESLISVRYPPYAGKLSGYKRLSELKPDFDRNGDRTTWGGLVAWIFGRSGSSGSSSGSKLGRSAVLVFLVAGVAKYLERRTKR
ncbi:MAG: hypothetical protein M1825_006271 [Sarcosagium campestre]|nr:MAG: hypothetical protein M1825_006271 [Sarcosagium campestre]